jgi:hypothetical protein
LLWQGAVCSEAIEQSRGRVDVGDEVEDRQWQWEWEWVPRRRRWGASVCEIWEAAAGEKRYDKRRKESRLSEGREGE